jgi:hypothetical protein
MPLGGPRREPVGHDEHGIAGASRRSAEPIPGSRVQPSAQIRTLEIGEAIARAAPRHQRVEPQPIELRDQGGEIERIMTASRARAWASWKSS